MFNSMLLAGFLNVFYTIILVYALYYSTSSYLDLDLDIKFISLLKLCNPNEWKLNGNL